MRKAWIWILVVCLFLTGGCQSRQKAEGHRPDRPAQTVLQTRLPTEAPTEPEPENPFHSGIREDGTFDEGALFIGDSLTYGLVSEYLIPRQLLGDARYMAIPGAAPTAFVYGPRLQPNGRHYCFYSEEFEGLSMSEGVAEVGETTTAVYFMMGTNYANGVDVQLYIDILDHILQACPKATVYLQRVPYATSNKVDATAANKRIDEAYAHFAQLEETRVRLIDTREAIGYKLTNDGIHLTEQGQAAWYEALLAYARDNGIPQ